MKSKHYFAAANTGKGFYNLFDNINDSRREGFLYILKGGLGTGKSTLMKKAGKYFEGLGEVVEYFYCSSDADSLDGVRLVRANTAIADGTAPHVTEAQMPGVTDAVINLGEFIGPGVKEHREEIEKLAAVKRASFAAAYAYIRAAAELDSVSSALSERGAGKSEIGSVIDGICSRVTIGDGDNRRERRLFISAVAGEGKTSLTGENEYGQIINLTGGKPAARAALNGLCARLRETGRGFTSFCDILNPNEREAIQIGDDTLIIAGGNGGEETGFEETVKKLLGLAAGALSEARAAHKEIEAFYIPCMDFKGLDLTTEKLIKEISETLNIPKNNI